MFSVVFEVHPKSDKWDAYLGYAKMLRPELEQVEGFVDNIRYKSLNRDGWILSLSNWDDEKAVVRWRTKMKHHEVQELGRGEVLSDYHLRVGQITSDSKLPEGFELKEKKYQTEDEELSKIISNEKLSEHFKSLARDLDVLEPKHPDQIFKAHLEERKQNLQ